MNFKSNPGSQNQLLEVLHRLEIRRIHNI